MFIYNKQIFNRNNNGSPPKLVLLNSAALFFLSEKYQAPSKPLQRKRSRNVFYMVHELHSEP